MNNFQIAPQSPENAKVIKVTEVIKVPPPPRRNSPPPKHAAYVKTCFQLGGTAYIRKARDYMAANAEYDWSEQLAKAEAIEAQLAREVTA